MSASAAFCRPSPFRRVPQAGRGENDCRMDAIARREDAAFAARYLNGIFAEGGQAGLPLARRRMAQACGGVPGIAEKAPPAPA